MIVISSNFSSFDDIGAPYSVDESGITLYSCTRVTDPELNRLAQELRLTEQGDIDTYLRKWIAFQRKYNEVLPSIPLYGNVYFDFYPTDLEEYPVSRCVSWAEAILGLKFIK